MSAEKQQHPIHSGHRERLRSSYLAQGFSNFSDINILELLLFFTIARGDTNPIAHGLLDEFHALSAVLEASEAALCNVAGIGEKSAAFLHQFPELFQIYLESVCRSKDGDFADAKEMNDLLVSRYYGIDEETVYLLLLTSNGKMRFCQPVSNGKTGGITLDIRRIVELCAVYRCSFAVIAYNHPDGYALPTKEDIFTAKALIHILRHFSVRLFDHLIISEGAYSSMRSAGILTKLEREERLRSPEDEMPMNANAIGAEPHWCKEQHPNPFSDWSAVKRLLSFVLPAEKCDELAESLVSGFGSLAAILEAPYEELLHFPQMSPSAALLLHQFPDLFRIYVRDVLHRQQDTFQSQRQLYEFIVSQFVGFREEQVQLMLLSDQGKMLYCASAANGGFNGVSLHPRDILAVCRNYNCRNVILMHNHPSGFLLPSREDVLNTKKIQKTLAEISVYLYDHVIVADGEYLSMREKGLLE